MSASGGADNMHTVMIMNGTNGTAASLVKKRQPDQYVTYYGYKSNI